MLYADDVKIYQEVRNRSDWNFIQNDLNAVSEWCDYNKLELNINKCKFMVLSRQLLCEIFNYSIKGEKLLQIGGG